MSKPGFFLAAGAAAFLAASAWSQPAPAPLPTRPAMVDGVNPAALTIWEVSNAAMGEDGALDPALLGAEAWARLEEAAEMLQLHSHRMAQARSFVAGGPDLVSGELPPGVASRAEIQAMIDADPDGFRASAAQMEAQAAALLAAVRTRDVHATGELAFGIDAACQSCHERYWFPQTLSAGDAG